MKEICWWCNGRLDPKVFAEVKDLDGNPLRVHLCCKLPADRHFRPHNFGQCPMQWDGYYS